MNDNKFLVSRLGGTTTALLLAFLLFYFPSMLSLVSRSGEPLVWSVTGVVMATFYTVVFCANYFILVPWLLRHPEKKSLFFLLNFILIVGICGLIPIWFQLSGGFPFPKAHKQNELTTGQYILGYLRFIMRDGIMMVLAAALSYAMRLSEARELLRRRELEMSAEQRQLELRSLKAQLNPHFLFNSLNNIYALIGFAPERAQKALHDLSNMLRFMIYESGSSTVALAKEIQFITDYTALMSLRLNSNIRVECKVMEFPPSDVMVTPLIFLTLVENAFKHVAPLPDGTGFIRIEIDIRNNQLYGSVANSYIEKKGDPSSEKSDSGIGLENVRRQLRLLYPDNHTFSIINKEGVFSASLSIPLSALRMSQPA